MIVVVLLLAVTLLTSVHALAMAQQAPYVLADKPLYTLRDKQVLLQGGGFAPNRSYFVWLQTPTDNFTSNTGLSFITTENGELPSIPPGTTPPAVVLPISRNSTLGTYLVSISNSTVQDWATARTHFGVWDTDKSGYHRMEIVQAMGGGVLPKETLRVTIRDPSGTIASDVTVNANSTGAFLATWKVPPDALTESYTILVQGTGTYDDAQAEFASTSRFTVAPATLNVAVHKQPEGSYERTQSVSAEFVILYPDMTPVVTMKENLMPVLFYAGQFRRADVALLPTDMTSGIWAAERKIQRNATLGGEYRFVMLENAFDDGYGNVGPVKNVETGNFSVVPATLQVKIVLNSTSYQIPLDTITAYTQVSYPDGLLVTNATVEAMVNRTGSVARATVSYNTTAAVWIARYPFSLEDLSRSGAWSLTVEVMDIYGNAGSASLQTVTEPYVFIAIVLVIVFALLVVRWLLSRYWHRLYLRAKRASSAFRDRGKSPALGPYCENSPSPLAIME